ncbi:MAG: polymer-forming cytoskeletal protein [Candidatus Edwardsbacteria bacterium]
MQYRNFNNYSFSFPFRASVLPWLNILFLLPLITQAEDTTTAETIKVLTKIGRHKKPITLTIEGKKEMKHGDIYVAPSDTIEEDVVTTGGSITVDGLVDGDVAAIGGNVNIKGRVTGDVAAIGGNAEVSGIVEGDAAAIGGEAEISGTVEGDLAVIGGKMILDSTAVIKGDVATLGGELERAEGSKVEGEIKTLSLGLINQFIPKTIGTLKFGFEHPFLMRSFKCLIRLFWFLGTLVLIILTVVLLPQNIERMAEATQQEFLKVVIFGIIGEILIAPLIVLLAISILGLPLIPIAGILILVAFLFGLSGVSLVLGQRLKENLHWSISSNLGLTILGFLLISLFIILGALLSLFGRPLSILGFLFSLIGILILYATATIGFGASLLTILGTKTKTAGR